MDSKLLLLMVFATCSIIPLVFTVKSSSESCKALNDCSKNVGYGPDGTWFYQRLESKPATKQEWTTLWENNCLNEHVRANCLYGFDRVNCRQSGSIKIAKVAAYNNNLMCFIDGREYFKRLYHTPGSCLGNRIASDLLIANRNLCLDVLLEELKTYPSRDVICRALKAARFCEEDYAEDLCGYLGRWVLSQVWKNRIEAAWNECLWYNNATYFDMPYPDPYASYSD